MPKKSPATKFIVIGKNGIFTGIFFEKKIKPVEFNVELLLKDVFNGLFCLINTSARFILFVK